MSSTTRNLGIDVQFDDGPSCPSVTLCHCEYYQDELHAYILMLGFDVHTQLPNEHDVKVRVIFAANKDAILIQTQGQMRSIREKIRTLSITHTKKYLAW